jgi:uncharacterized protein involved in outer membrane biogenesis
MRWLRRAGWLLLGLGLAWGLWCALAWWALPPLLKTQAQARLSAELGRAVTIGRVRIDPNALSLEVDDLTVAALESGRPPQLQLPRFLVDLDPASLWRRAVVIDRLELDGLRITLLRRGRWQLDVNDLIQRWLAPAPQPAERSLPRLVLHGARIRDAQLVLDDPAARTSHRIDALDFSLPALSTLPEDADRPIGATLALQLDGSAVHVAGEGTPWAAPRRADWKITIHGFDLARLVADLDAELPLRLKSGRLSAALGVHLAQAPGAEPALDLQGSVGVADLALQYPGGAPALGWRDLQVQIGSLQPLMRRVQLQQVKVDGLRLPVARDRAGALNLAALAGGGAKPRVAPGTPSGPGWQVDVDALQFDGAQVGWRDATLSPAEAFDLAGAQLKLQRLHWPMTEPAAVQGSAQLRQASGRDAGRIAFDGEAGLDRAALKFKLDAIALPAFQPYAAAWLEPAIDAGSAAAQGRIDWTAAGGLRLALTDAKADGVAIGGAGWRQLAVQGLALDLAARQVKVQSVRLIEPRFALGRDRAGRWNLDRWLRPTSKSPPAAPAARKPSAPGAAAKATPPWQLQVERIALAGGHLEFDDSLPTAGESPPLKIRADDLVLRARALRWPMPRGAPALRLHAGSSLTVLASAADKHTGRWTLDGNLQLAPPGFEGRLQVDGLPLAALAGYAPLPVDLRLLGADGGYRGTLALHEAKGGWQVAAAGDAKIDDLRIAEKGAGDDSTGDDLLRWRTLAANGLKLQLAPGERPAVAIDELSLAGVDARLVVSEQGKLNLATVAATRAAPPAQPEPVAPAAPAAAAEPWPIDLEVDRTRLVDGRIDFADHFIRPNYRAELSDLNGQLGKFRSDSSAMAPIVLGGTVAGSGQLQVSGELNPTAHPLALDLRARATDIDLPPLSPYAGKYAGYGITGGKLSVDLAYRIDPDGKLTATNRVVLNRLTFGAPVESPDAIKLPVRFIVSLLQDRNGVIDFNLPISGSINSPDFSLGPVIFELLLKKLGQAVASPFAAITGGSGDHPGVIEFVPGTAKFVPAAAAALDKVAAALADRPALTLDVAGSAVPAVDRDAYRRAALDARLAALAQTGQPGAAPPEGEARARLLRRLYRETPLPDKPRNLIGLPSDVPVEQMQALLLAAIPAGDDVMRELALQRALAVRAGLIERGLAAERLFVAQPVIDSASPAPPPQARLTLVAK